MIRLLIFDVDGTLAETHSLTLLPCVQKFFKMVSTPDCRDRLQLAFATNQGGVGKRIWMEKDEFGNPEQYPTQEEIEQRLKTLIERLGIDPELPVYVSYRYQNRQGQWSPVPATEAQNPRWLSHWRKPQPGMLERAIADAGVDPSQAMYIGDREQDRQAARAVGCAFMWASQFFGRDWRDCREMLAQLSRR